MRRSQLLALLLAVVIGFGSFAAVLAVGWTPVLGVQLQGGVEVLLRPTAPVEDEQLDRAIEIIRSRVDALGVAEPDITRQGEQVVIQLPGVKDKQRAVDLVGQTAELRFRPVLDYFDPFDAESVQNADARLEQINGSIVSVVVGEQGEVTQEPVQRQPGITTPENDIASDAVMLTDRSGVLGYVLGPAELTGEAVADAAATFNNQWIVDLELTEDGAVGFDELAAKNYQGYVAIVLDGIVESAPQIQATEFDGQAVISGSFEEQEARDLAVALRFGALPVEFEQDDVRTVSATLGEGTLRAGVIAGIVGLIVVGVYMLVYYRMLGIVAVASLAMSGALLWALISWLGESRGLALTLAGTTGIIVSIGVQVDSNIVYYERIREEVRRGRALRSAADASFGGAFATIVWADLASLIGAGVLYQLTSGTVRGFALYLGLATLIDLAVSYFFMRPLVVFVVRKLIGERPALVGVSASESAPTPAGGAA